MLYYLTIALQVFCVYHMYKHKNSYYWIFLIIFLPVVGCLVYLITQVYSKRDVDRFQEDFTTIINPTKKVKDLERTLEFSETFQNRVNLADAYLEIKDYNNAITQYKNAIVKDFNNNKYVIFQLIQCYYRVEDYDKVVFYAEKVKHLTEFKGSKAQFFFGMSLAELGQIDLAEIQLKAINQRYSNYDERLALAQFLVDKNKTTEAKELLEEIYNESLHMTSSNKRKYRSTIKQVEHLLKTI